jgi:hypothetical protein
VSSAISGVLKEPLTAKSAKDAKKVLGLGEDLKQIR